MQDRAQGVYWRYLPRGVVDISILGKNINNIYDFVAEIKKLGKNVDWRDEERWSEMGKILVQELTQSVLDTRTHMTVKLTAAPMISQWEYIVPMSCLDDAQGIRRRSHLPNLRRLILYNRKRYDRWWRLYVLISKIFRMGVIYKQYLLSQHYQEF